MDLWVAKKWTRDVQVWKGWQLEPPHGTNNTSGQAVRNTHSFINNSGYFTDMTQATHNEWDLITNKEPFTVVSEVAIFRSHNR
jgi:hypothetical protein